MYLFNGLRLHLLSGLRNAVSHNGFTDCHDLGGHVLSNQQRVDGVESKLVHHHLLAYRKGSSNLSRSPCVPRTKQTRKAILTLKGDHLLVRLHKLLKEHLCPRSSLLGFTNGVAVGPPSPQCWACRPVLCGNNGGNVVGYLIGKLSLPNSSAGQLTKVVLELLYILWLYGKVPVEDLRNAKLHFVFVVLLCLLKQKGVKGFG